PPLYTQHPTPITPLFPYTTLFRSIAEILQASGAKLREVGATNKTTRKDYEQAISPDTAMILKVHRSNFSMSGFVESVSSNDISADRKSTRLNSSHQIISYAVFCLK